MSVTSSVRRGWGSDRPVLWRLLPPLAVMLVLLILGGGWGLWRQLQAHMMEKQLASGVSVLDAVRTALRSQADLLSGQVQPIAADPGVKQALREGDVERLKADWMPVFVSLQKDLQFTHFNFIGTNRVSLLRLHKPELKGDVIDRPNLLEAERTGRIAPGLVIGQVGTLVLRVAQPVFDEEKLMGYVELGKEIEYILEDIHLPPGSYFAATMHKRCMGREQWQEWLEFWDRKAEWGRLEENVLIYSSMDPLPEAFNAMADRDPSIGRGLAFRNAEIEDGGREWRVTATALRDARGDDVGELLVMTDVTVEMDAFRASLLQGGLMGGVLLVSILGVLAVLLRRTDLCLLVQRREQDEIHRRMLSVLNSLDASVYVADLDTHQLLFVNEYGLKNWGRDIVGKPCWSALQGQPGPCSFCTRAERLLESGGGETRVSEIQNRLNGRWYALRDKVVSWADGRKVRLEIATDITAQKESEAALRKERDKAQLFLDMAEVIFVALDPEGTVTLINRKGCELLGLPQEQIIGRNWFDHFLPASVREDTFRYFKRIMAGECHRVESNENPVRTAGGGERTVLWGSTFLRNEDGKVAGTFSSGMDVTDRKKMEEQLARIQKTESLGRMAGAVAHHYNNLLQVVIGNLEMAMDDLPRNFHTYEEVENALRASRRAASLGGVMLTYIGESFARQERVDLCELCRESLPALKLNMPGTVALETDFPVPGPVVCLNAEQIRHLLSNLVVNAWEAMGGKSGVVSLKVGKVEGRALPVQNRVPADFVPSAPVYASLEVRDTGCGIAPEALGKLFDPFYSTKFVGRGLGLAVAQGYLKAHNGCITVESTPGEGSTFCIFLPLAEET